MATILVAYGIYQLLESSLNTIKNNDFAKNSFKIKNKRYDSVFF